MFKSVLILTCFCSAAAVCLSPGRGTASEQVPESSEHRKLTLAQVIAVARANYPQIQAAHAQQKAAQGSVGVARAAYLPRTDLLWQTNRATANNIYGLLLPQSVIPSISGPVIASDVSRSAWSSGGAALLTWQPFDFGARSAKVLAAQKGSEAAKQAAALTDLEVSAGAGSAFFDLAAAHQLVTVAEANVKRMEIFDQAVHVLVDNTLRAGADASQADAQLALARNQLIQAQTQEAQKKILDRSYLPAFNTLGAVSGRGAGTTLTGNFPGGTAGLAPDTFNWAAGVQVTFSAFDYFGLHEQKKVQQANVEAEHARYNLAIDDISVAVEQARATLAGARQMAANTPIELTAARTSEQQQQARYRSGLASVVDVAAAEGVLAQAEADDVIARLSVWRAQLGVAAAQGDLEPFIQMLKSQP